MVWMVEAADGSCGRAEIQLGECLLLFTSLDTLHTFVSGCEGRADTRFAPAVFSRNRKEFGRRAREAAQTGIIGALFDPAPGTGKAPFLRFAKPARQ
jgi:hypothetical protein